MSNTELELRDRIAIEALNGMLAHPIRYKPIETREGVVIDWHMAIAKEAYSIADAMLIIRQDTPTVAEAST